MEFTVEGIKNAWGQIFRKREPTSVTDLTKSQTDGLTERVVDFNRPVRSAADRMRAAESGSPDQNPNSGMTVVGKGSYTHAEGASQLGADAGNSQLAGNAHKEAVEIAQGK